MSSSDKFTDVLVQFSYAYRMVDCRVKFAEQPHNTYAFADDAVISLPGCAAATKEELYDWKKTVDPDTQIKVRVTWGPETYPRLIHRFEIV